MRPLPSLTAVHTHRTTGVSSFFFFCFFGSKNARFFMSGACTRWRMRVLIFDEIQTLPVRCVHIFNNNNAIRSISLQVEQCGSKVVPFLCTATQPLLDQVDKNKGAIRLSEPSEIMGPFSMLPRYVTYDRRKMGGWEHADAKAAALAIAKSQTERTRRELPSGCEHQTRGEVHLQRV